jgi:hypothetical protein
MGWCWFACLQEEVADALRYTLGTTYDQRGSVVGVERWEACSYVLLHSGMRLAVCLLAVSHCCSMMFTWGTGHHWQSAAAAAPCCYDL